MKPQSRQGCVKLVVTLTPIHGPYMQACHGAASVRYRWEEDLRGAGNVEPARTDALCCHIQGARIVDQKHTPISWSGLRYHRRVRQCSRLVELRTPIMSQAYGIRPEPESWADHTEPRE